MESNDWHMFVLFWDITRKAYSRVLERDGHCPFFSGAHHPFAAERHNINTEHRYRLRLEERLGVPVDDPITFRHTKEYRYR